MTFRPARKSNALSPQERRNKEASFATMQGILRDELGCPICRELLVKTVILNCAHQFCRECIAQWETQNQNCPVCREPISSFVEGRAQDNLVLRCLDQFLPEDQEDYWERQDVSVPNQRDDLTEGDF